LLPDRLIVVGQEHTLVDDAALLTLLTAVEESGR